MTLRRSTWLLLAALALLSFALYARNIDDYFLGDDFDLIESFYGQPPSYFPELLWNDESGSVWDYLCLEPGSTCPHPDRHGFLRPFKIWVLALDFAAWGVHPLGYHVTSTVFFIACILLVFGLLLELLPGHSWLAFVGAATAAMHPVFAEIVPSITYREETMACAFALASLLCFLRSRRRGAASFGFHVFYALAILTKESAVSAVGLALGYDLVQILAAGGRGSELARRARTYVPTGLILAGYFGLRFAAFGNLVGGHGETDFLDPARFVAFHSTLLPYLFERPMFAFSWVPAIGWASVAAVAGSLGLLWWRRDRLETVDWARLAYTGPVWYAATTAIAYGVYFSPRHILLPVMGLILFTVSLLASLSRAFDWERDGATAVAVLALAAAAFLPPTLEMSRRFHAAAASVEQMRTTIETHTATLPAGARVLLINVPERRVLPPPFFGHALQSALKRPFTPSDVGNRAIRFDTIPGWAAGPEAAAGYDLVLRFEAPRAAVGSR